LERQLQNLDDNYNQIVLIVWGTIDNYISQARRGGKKIQFTTAWNTYLGALARFSTDYDINVFTFTDKSSAARFICKRFEKHGTLGRSSTYRVMRKTASEDRRIDILMAAGCSEGIAKRLLNEFGSIAEMIEMTSKELQVIEGVGKIRAERILVCLNSEKPVADQRVRMTRA
jgi:ERCC4-type nuclease